MRTSRRHAIVYASICALIDTAAAQPFLTSIDILGPGDDALHLPPPGVLCVDVLVDVSSLSGAWWAAGVRVVSQNGATLRYATDPNSGSPILTNPGTSNRFVTFFGTPRPRDADARFTSAAAAASGRYSPTGPTPTITPTEVNVAYFASPPPTFGSPAVDGGVFRASINLPPGHTADEYTLVSHQWGGLIVPPDAILHSTGGQPGDVGTINVALGSEHGTEYDWYVAPIPEPCSATGILVLALVNRLRR